MAVVEITLVDRSLKATTKRREFRWRWVARLWACAQFVFPIEGPNGAIPVGWCFVKGCQ